MNRLAAAEAGKALRLLGDITYHDRNFRDAATLFQRAMAVGNARTRAECGLGLAFCLNGVGDWKGAVREGRRALTIATKLGDDGLLAEALAVVTIARCIHGLGTDEVSLRKALELEDLDRPTLIEFRPSFIAGLLRLYTWRFDEGRELLTRLTEEMAIRGEDSELPFVLGNLGWLECWAGNFDAARRCVNQAVDHARRTGSEATMAMAQGQRALFLAHAGDELGSRIAAEVVFDHVRRHGFSIEIIWATAAVGLLALSRGESHAASEIYAPLLPHVESSGLGNPLTHFYVPDAIESLIAVGEVDRAGLLINRLDERGHALVLPWAQAMASRNRSLLLQRRGDGDAALVEIARALEHHDHFHMPFELGRTWLTKGRIERRLRRKRAAHDSLDEARRIFATIGARLWLEATLRELRRVGLRHVGADELTETERAVAQLAAAGHTNREVAAKLFISPKTVEANLARVYRKLGIRSRAELGGRFET